MIETTIIIILLAFVVVIADGFRRVYIIRRDEAKEIRRRVAELLVDQEWQSNCIVYDNPFRQAPSLNVRITALKANHAGDIWVEFCFLDTNNRLVTRYLPATKFCEVYTVKIERNEQERTS